MGTFYDAFMKKQKSNDVQHTYYIGKKILMKILVKAK